MLIEISVFFTPSNSNYSTGITFRNDQSFRSNYHNNRRVMKFRLKTNMLNKKSIFDLPRFCIVLYSFFVCFLFSLLSNSFILTYTDFSVLNFKICHKTFDVARINVCFKTFHNCFIVGQWWKFTSHRV